MDILHGPWGGGRALWRKTPSSSPRVVRSGRVDVLQGLCRGRGAPWSPQRGLVPQTPPPHTKAEAWERKLEVRVKRLTSAIRRLENMGSHPPPRVQTRHEVRLMPPSVSSSKEEFLVNSRSASSFNKVSRLSDEEEGAPGQHEDLTTSSTAQSRAVSAAGGQRRSPRHRQPGQVPQHEAKQQQPG